MRVHHTLNRGNLPIRGDELYLRCLLAWTDAAEDDLADKIAQVPFSAQGRRALFLMLFWKLSAIARAGLGYLRDLKLARIDGAFIFAPDLAPLQAREKAARELMAELESDLDGTMNAAGILLQPMLAHGKDFFVEAAGEFLDRLVNDGPRIARMFLGRDSLDAVCDIIAKDADLHFHGRNTCVVKTQSGSFVYKPHDLTADSLTGRFVAEHFADCLKIPACIAGEGYGWCEFVQQSPIVDEAGADRFFWRLGASAALFTAIGSTDLHYGNWLVSGDMPVLVDLETILTPVPQPFSDPEMKPGWLPDEGFLHDLSRSIANTGLLPQRIDVGQTGKQMSVLFRGIGHTVLGHETSLLRGFDDGYRRCMDNQGELEEFVRSFEDMPVRMIVRQTAYYGDMLQKLRDPANLTSVDRQRRVCDSLCDYLANHGASHLEGIARWEEECLLDGDIPFFYSLGKGHDLLGFDGSLVAKDFLARSAVQNALEWIEGLGDVDRRFERAVLEQSISRALLETPEETSAGDKGSGEATQAGDKGSGEAAPTGDKGAASSAVLMPDEAVAEAEGIFNKLDALLIDAPSGERSWAMRGGGSALFAALPTFASGSAGLGVFFAAVAATTRDEEACRRARELAGICLGQIERSVRYLSGVSQLDSGALPLGIADGVGGVLCVLHLMDIYLRDPLTRALARDILAIVRKVELGGDTRIDAYAGIAGLIIALCENPDFVTDEDARCEVDRLATWLLAARTLPLEAGGSEPRLWDTLGKGWPISGAAHGMAGIACALAHAAQVTGNEKYLVAAADALDFESRVYDQDLGNWPDLREDRHSKTSMNALCSGAPGIGLVMLDMAGTVESGGSVSVVCQENLMRAAYATLASPMRPFDYLCCGKAAVSRFLVSASEALKGGKTLGENTVRADRGDANLCDAGLTDAHLADECRETAGRILWRMRERASYTGDYRYAPLRFRNVFDPGFFFGAAGVGYEFLHYAFPDTIR